MDHISKHQTEVPQNQGPLLPALRRCATGDELRLNEALQEERIAHLEEVEPLAQALRYAMMLVGLREQNLPSPEETLVLVQYIAHHYGGHTVAEIKLAFELALNGTLGVDARCFENFSVAYFCSVMNAYREWARATHPFLPQESRPQLPPAQTTDEEYLAAVLSVYRIGRDWRAIPLLAYKVLDESGKLTLTRPDKDRIAAHVAQLTGEAGNKDLCRRWAVKEYLDRILLVTDSVKNP